MEESAYACPRRRNAVCRNDVVELTWMATSGTLLLHGQAVSRGIRPWDCNMTSHPKPVFRLDHRGIAASSGHVLFSTWDLWTEIGDRADASPGFIYGRMLDMNAPGLLGVPFPSSTWREMAGDVRLPRASNSTAPMVFECGEVHINQSPTLEHVVCFGSTKSNPRRAP